MAVNYKDSGVDVEEGYNAVNEYKVHAKRTRIPGLLTTACLKSQKESKIL